MFICILLHTVISKSTSHFCNLAFIALLLQNTQPEISSITDPFLENKLISSIGKASPRSPSTSLIQSAWVSFHWLFQTLIPLLNPVQQSWGQPQTQYFILPSTKLQTAKLQQPKPLCSTPKFRHLRPVCHVLSLLCTETVYKQSQ